MMISFRTSTSLLLMFLYIQYLLDSDIQIYKSFFFKSNSTFALAGIGEHFMKVLWYFIFKIQFLPA